MKKAILSIVLGAVCLGAYADEAEEPIAAYKDNPNQPGSEADPGRDADAVAPIPASEECTVVIEGNDQMKYDIDKFTVAQDACEEFTITLKHVGSLPVAAMGHNVVLSRAGDMDGIVADGISAGLENEYVKPDDDRVLAMTLMIGGGEESSITFDTEKLDAGAEYKFFCTFPGHASMMNGVVTVTAM